MPPFLSALGGAGKFVQLAALEKIKGDIALKQALIKEKRKVKKNQKVIEVGTREDGTPLTFTFNVGDGLAGTGKERANAGLIDIFNNVSKKDYEQAIRTGTPEQIQNFQGFLTSRHFDWNVQNRRTVMKEGQAKADTNGYIDVYNVFKPQLLNYGLNYARKVVNPSYQNAVSDWVARHPELKGTFVMNKVHDNSGNITYEFAPTIVGRDHKSDLLEMSKKLDLPMEEVANMFKVRGAEVDSDKHAVPYLLYRKMKKFGPITDVAGFTGADDLLKIRNEAMQSGMGNKQFMNLLRTLPANMLAMNKQFIFVDPANKANYSTAYMEKQLGIDRNARNQAAGGAIQAAITGRNFIKTLKAGGPASVGIPGNLNVLINAFTSQTGPFAGFRNTIANFFADDRFRYQGQRDNYFQKKLQKRLKDAEEDLQGGGFLENKRAAQYRGYIEFMKFQLAYQMASALQGGTGGRTISDQDVENMMASMNFSSASDINHIIGSLERLSNIMGELHLINSYYAQSPQHAGAARLYEMVNASGGSPFTTEAVLNLIEKATDKNIKDTDRNRVGAIPIIKDGKLIGFR